MGFGVGECGSVRVGKAKELGKEGLGRGGDGVGGGNSEAKGREGRGRVKRVGREGNSCGV